MLRALLFTLLISQAALADTAVTIKNVPVNLEGGSWVSDWVEFDLPKNVESFQLLVTGSSDQVVQITDLISPDGTQYVQSAGGRPPKINPYTIPILRNVMSPNRSEGVSLGTGSLNVPNNPNLPTPLPGRWKMRSLSHSEPKIREVDFYISARQISPKLRNQIRAKVFVSTDPYWKDRLTPLLLASKKFFAESGLDLEVTEVVSLTPSPSKALKLPDDLSRLALANNDSDAVNVYLMGAMENQSKPVNGLACLGGPIGISAKHSCFVSMFASHDASVITNSQLSKILVHEISHYLGLFHTKDTSYFQIGDVFDPIDDTPKEVTGSNIMDPGIHNETPLFTKTQKRMLLLSPVLR